MNVVEEYLSKCPEKKLSYRTISKELGIKKRRVRRLAALSKHIRYVNPIEVGSNRCFVSVCAWSEEELDLAKKLENRKNQVRF